MHFTLTPIRSIVIGLACGLISAVLTVGGIVEVLDLMLYDRILEWRGQRRPAAPIVIVTVDESSFAELNVQWPFPRAMHAEVLDRITAGQPLAIGIDFVFDMPSSRGPTDDDALGAAVARAGNVVLAAATTLDTQATYSRFAVNWPIGVIATRAAAVGATNMNGDLDGRIRRAPMTVRGSDKTLAAFGVAVYRLAQSAEQATAAPSVTSDFLINFRGGRRTFRWLPYHRVLRGDVSPEMFHGKIVLIGTTSELLHDLFSTPFAQRGDMPGIEIQANAIDTLFAGDSIREISPAVSAAAALVISVIIAMLVAWVPTVAVTTSLLCSLGIAAGTAIVKRRGLPPPAMRGTGDRNSSTDLRPTD
jgi:CHASE2 domain-containing sensor protein